MNLIQGWRDLRSLTAGYYVSRLQREDIRLILVDIASLRFPGEAVDHVKRGFCSRRVLTITLQTLLGQLQMTLGNGNIVGICRNLIPERLEVTHLFSFR